MNIFTALRRIHPSGLLLGTVLAGILVLLANFAIGSAQITYANQDKNVTHNVGYANAPNWSIGFILVAPLSMYFMLSAFRSADHIPRRLREARMIVSEDGKIINEDDVTARWTALLRGASRWAVPLFGLALIINFAEWWTNSAYPLIQRHLPVERDWSVAALIPGNDATGHFLLNGAVSFAAFGLQAFYTIALVTFLLFVYAFSELIRELADRDVHPVLVLSVGTTDTRRGFQIFEGVVENILLASAFGFIIFYLSRIWNLYLPSSSKSVWDYSLPDLVAGMKKKDLSSVIDRMVDIGGGLNYSGLMVILGALILFSLSVAVPLLLLRKAALEAKQTTIDLINRGSTEFLTTNVQSALDESRHLTVWPLGYPKANQLLLLAVIACLSMFLFRVGLFYLGLMIIYVLKKGYDAVK
jgi:hypothetical protein